MPHGRPAVSGDDTGIPARPGARRGTTGRRRTARRPAPIRPVARRQGPARHGRGVPRRARGGRVEQQILDAFDRNANPAPAALGNTPDAEFKKPWAFKVAGRTVDTSPKYTVYRRTVLNHLAHHRGQLTVYLRLNDAPVPAVYGPTADEPNF